MKMVILVLVNVRSSKYKTFQLSQNILSSVYFGVPCNVLWMASVLHSMTVNRSNTEGEMRHYWNPWNNTPVLAWKSWFRRWRWKWSQGVGMEEDWQFFPCIHFSIPNFPSNSILFNRHSYNAFLCFWDSVQRGLHGQATLNHDFSMGFSTNILCD